MKKEDFISLGIGEDLAIKLEEKSIEELKNYIPYERFKEVIDEKNGLKTALSERDNQLETLKKSNEGIEGLKSQINKLQAENKEKSEKYDAEIKAIRLNNAIDTALLKANGKNLTAIKALLNAEKLEIEEDGTVKGLDKQIKDLMESDGYLFGTNEPAKPVGFSPAQSSTTNTGQITKEQFNKMGYKEKVELYNQNKELYDQLVAE